MILKIYKPLMLTALLFTAGPGFAQDTTWHSNGSSDSNLRIAGIDLGIDKNDVHMAMSDLKISLKEGLHELNSSLRIVGPEIKGAIHSLNINGGNDSRMDVSVQQGDISEKVKNYTKTYPMDGNDRLSINNQYGKVVVETWNKSEVQVDVQIKSYSDDDRTAQKMIDAISISDNKSGDAISFSTSFSNGSGGSIWDLFNNQNDRHRAEVDYTIHMPAKNAFGVYNRYGSIQLPDMDGPISIDCAYGNVAAKSLRSDNNHIGVKYGNASIDALGSADVAVKYGNLDLGSVDKLNFSIGNGAVRIGRIKTSANINARYAGGVQIDNLDKNFKNFSYSSSYSNLRVGIDNSSNANFDVTVRYGNFDYSGVPLHVTEKTPSDESKGWKPTKNFKGYIGRSNPDNKINISSSYGDVKFE